MGLEIERKFLVTDAPDPDLVVGEARLRQGYLAVDGRVELRLREVDGTTTMTVKAGSGLARTEVEVVLDTDDAAGLWPHTQGRALAKRRQRVSIGPDTIAELDIYDAPLDGLRVVEVEFPDADAAEAFVPPGWFGREVTGEPGWSNADLARHGAPT